MEIAGLIIQTATFAALGFAVGNLLGRVASLERRVRELEGRTNSSAIATVKTADGVIHRGVRIPILLPDDDPKVIAAHIAEELEGGR